MSNFSPNTIGVSWEPFSHPSLPFGMNGQHAFIVYTNADGVSYVLEHGDPYFMYDQPSQPYDGSWNDYLRYRVGVLDDKTPHPHPESVREQMGPNGVIYKSSSDFPGWTAQNTFIPLDIPKEILPLVWEEMIEHAEAIKDSRTFYEFGLQGPVSNSVVASILADIGFSLSEVTGIYIPQGLSLNDPFALGSAVASGQISWAALGYGGISNTVSHVKSGNISGLTHAQIRGTGMPGGNGSDFDQSIANVSNSIDRLYTAAFGRMPDDNGRQFWVEVVSDPLVSLKDVSKRFIDSPEFMSIAPPDSSNEVFTEALFQNVLGREPDSSGLGFWMNQLNSGMQDRADVLIGFADSPENVALHETLA